MRGINFLFIRMHAINAYLKSTYLHYFIKKYTCASFFIYFFVFVFSDFAVVFSYNTESRSYNVSLRADEGPMDITTVARIFGGGGHPSMSTFFEI